MNILDKNGESYFVTAFDHSTQEQGTATSKDAFTGGDINASLTQEVVELREEVAGHGTDQLLYLAGKDSGLVSDDLVDIAVFQDPGIERITLACDTVVEGNDALLEALYHCQIRMAAAQLQDIDGIKGAECAGLFVNQTQIEQAVLQMLREQSRSFLEQHCLMQACIDKKLSSIQTELDANTNMTRRLQSRKAELYEQYRAGRISREKFADIQKTDSEKLARLSSRAEEIKRLLVEQYESRGNLAAGKRTADQIILLKDYDPEIIRNFVERVRVYPSGEIEIDMRTSSGFEFVTAS